LRFLLSCFFQNGKLLRAVTRILVNDPATGYGIFIENILETSPTCVTAHVGEVINYPQNELAKT